MIIIIPCHNESDNIGQLVQETKTLYPDVVVLVVDDGSTDNTAQIARDAGANVISNPPNAEYRCGFQAGCQYALRHGLSPVVFMNAGLSHNPRDIQYLVDNLNGSEVVAGTRFYIRTRGSRYNQSWWRSILSGISHVVLHLLVGCKEVDYDSFRAFSEIGCAKAFSLSQRTNTPRCHGFNPQLAYLFHKEKIKLAYVPIVYRATTSSLRARGVLWAAMCFAVFLIKEKLLLWR